MQEHEVSYLGNNSDQGLSHAVVLAEQQLAFEGLGMFPFELHFHPSATESMLAYDPSTIQSDFDPFDITEFVNYDG